MIILVLRNSPTSLMITIFLVFSIFYIVGVVLLNPFGSILGAPCWFSWNWFFCLFSYIMLSYMSYNIMNGLRNNEARRRFIIYPIYIIGKSLPLPRSSVKPHQGRSQGGLWGASPPVIWQNHAKSAPFLEFWAANSLSAPVNNDQPPVNLGSGYAPAHHYAV
jgi:hypothetical protein